MHFIVTLTFYSLMPSRELPILDFAFLNCSLEAGWFDIGFWYLLEMANINAQQPRMATKRKGKEVSPPLGWSLFTASDINGKKWFLPLHLISPGIFTLPIFWLPDIYLQGLYHHIIFYRCPLWELGQALTGHTDFRWLIPNIFRAQNAPISGFLIIWF